MAKGSAISDQPSGRIQPRAIESYRDLDAWRLGIRLTSAIYRLTASFPSSELYGLTTQLRRAAVSVPSNVAEGWGRGTTTEYLRFLRMARGSLYEVETQLIIAQDLQFVEEARMHEAIAIVGDAGRVLAGLLGAIESRLESDP
jgi:four helix bundle protein